MGWSARILFFSNNGGEQTCGRSFGKVRWSLINLCLICVWATLCTPPVDSKRVQGVVDTSDSSWIFLTRFCFLSTHGTLEYEIEYPVGYGTQDILLYFDTPGQWDAIYDRGKNCSEKTSVLSIVGNQIISLNTSYTQTSAYSGCSLNQKNGDTWYNCSSRRAFKSTRERWWYIALARCGAPKDSVKGLYAKYKIHMTNGDDFMHQEYSADEFYIFPINVTFSVIYVVMVILSGVCAVMLRKRNLFHSTYKLYMVSIVTWAMSLVLKVVAWGYYGLSGWEWLDVEVSGRVMQSLSQVAFILLLILMAKGYTITRGYLSITSIIKVTVFISFYCVTTCALFIWERTFFDAGKVLYYYESPPGYCMVALQLVAWCWFLYAAIFTLKHTNTKSLFYMPFFTFYTLWFWAGPIIIMVAMYAMEKWSREKTVNGVEQLVAFLGHLVFLVLTRPSAANSNFPYHVRTAQIDTFKDDKPNYHFDEKDADHYIIKKGPNLDFFLTGKETAAGNDGDNISTIGGMDEGYNGNGNNGVDNAAGVDPQYPPLDPKSCWFNMVPQPPNYEEASTQNRQQQPKEVQLPSYPQPSDLLPPIVPPPQPSKFQDIPLALISPPSLHNATEMETNIDFSSNQELIRPRLSIVSDPTVPVKNSLSPLAQPNTPPKNAPFSSPNQMPPNSTSIVENNSHNSSLKTNTHYPNQALPTINVNNTTSNSNPLLQLTPPSPVKNRLLNSIKRKKGSPSQSPLLKPHDPSDTITPAHTLPPQEFTPPTPRSNKHTFSSTIALLTKTADATNIDDIVRNQENNSSKNKKGKGSNRVILSQTMQEQHSKFYSENSSASLDTGSNCNMAPVGHIPARMRLPANMPPLPPPSPMVEKYLK